MGSTYIADALSTTGEPFFQAMKMYEQASKDGAALLDPPMLSEMISTRTKLQKDYLDRWQATASQGNEPVDGLILPVTPWAAARLGITQEGPYVGYTGIFNMLGESKVERLIVPRAKAKVLADGKRLFIAYIVQICLAVPSQSPLQIRTST